LVYFQAISELKWNLCFNIIDKTKKLTLRGNMEKSVLEKGSSTKNTSNQQTKTSLKYQRGTSLKSLRFTVKSPWTRCSRSYQGFYHKSHREEK